MNEDDRQRKEKNLPPVQGYGVAPNGFGTVSATAKRCVKLFGKMAKDGRTPVCDNSEQYFYLIDGLAKRMKTEHPAWFLKASAYASYELTPQNISKLPDNVALSTCIPRGNRPCPPPRRRTSLSANLEAWRQMRITVVWDLELHADLPGYDLRPSLRRSNALVPNATAILEQMKFYARSACGAWGRRSWDSRTAGHGHYYTSGKILLEAGPEPGRDSRRFLQGVLRRAWEPMLKWYKAMEDEARAKDIGSNWSGGSAATADLFNDELTAKMRGPGPRGARSSPQNGT